jgi:hypothetical protein
MAHEDTVYEIMQKLVIADTKTVSEVMSARGIWTAGQSAYQNTYKVLNTLTALGKLKKGGTYWKLPECQSEYLEHAVLLSKHLADILKLNIPAIVFREKDIPEVGLRPDALILLTKDNQGLCFILEAVNNETQQYLEKKRNIWKTWDGALKKLSSLFGYKIMQFELITSDTLQEFLEGL